MTCVGVQALETILNRCISGGEGKWGQKLKYISRSMKVYGLGNVRVTYAKYVDHSHRYHHQRLLS